MLILLKEKVETTCCVSIVLIPSIIVKRYTIIIKEPKAFFKMLKVL